MTQFLLVRHGEPDWDWAITQRYFGPRSTYMPLTSEGERQIESAARDELLSGADYILASPYTRTMQTAQIISRQLDLPVKVDFDLHEWIYDTNMRGDLPGEDDFYGMKDMSRCFLHYIEGGRQLEGHSCETLPEMRERVYACLKRHTDADKVIVACHEGVIRSITGLSVVDFGQIVPFTLPG